MGDGLTTDISTIIDEAFTSLFFGQGMILGLLIFIVIAVGLVLRWKMLGILVLPIIFMFEYQYYEALITTPGDMNFAWGMIILLVLMCFIIWRVFEQKGD